MCFKQGLTSTVPKPLRIPPVGIKNTFRRSFLSPQEVRIPRTRRPIPGLPCAKPEEYARYRFWTSLKKLSLQKSLLSKTIEEYNKTISRAGPPIGVGARTQQALSEGKSVNIHLVFMLFCIYSM